MHLHNLLLFFVDVCLDQPSNTDLLHEGENVFSQVDEVSSFLNSCHKMALVREVRSGV